jgi:hypothetical protein
LGLSGPRLAQNFYLIILFVPFMRTFLCVKHLSFGSFTFQKHFFGPPRDLSCAPLHCTALKLEVASSSALTQSVFEAQQHLLAPNAVCVCYSSFNNNNNNFYLFFMVIQYNNNNHFTKKNIEK